MDLGRGESIGHDGVIGRVGETDVEVLLVSRSACAECHAKGMCGMADAAVKTVVAKRPDFPVEKGQNVMVYARMGDALFSVLLAYVVPALLVVGLLVGMTLAGQEELAAACVALGSVVVYYLLLYACRKRIGRKIVFVVTPNI